MVDIAAIERSTLAAVPPLAQEELAGWLLAFDPGTVGRCHSAVPLSHEVPPGDLLDPVESRYAQAGLPAVLRLPGVPAFDAFRVQLHERGYRSFKPTLVQVARLADLPPESGAREVEIRESAGADWEQVFLGEGFDPVDGASRLSILRRARGSLFAAIRLDGRIVAVGCAGLAHGWCGIHGMRTLPAVRGRGLARSVIAALAREAQARGLSQAFLQVEQGNTVALSLYGRLGFTTAWGYTYWKKA